MYVIPSLRYVFVLVLVGPSIPYIYFNDLQEQYAHVHYDTRVPCQNGLRRRAMCKTQNYFAVSESTMMESEDFNIEEKGSELIEQQ